MFLFVLSFFTPSPFTSSNSSRLTYLLSANSIASVITSIFLPQSAVQYIYIYFRPPIAPVNIEFTEKDHFLSGFSNSPLWLSRY